MADVLVISIILIYCVLVIRKTIRDKKNGKSISCSGCKGGSCNGCKITFDVEKIKKEIHAQP